MTPKPSPTPQPATLTLTVRQPGRTPVLRAVDVSDGPSAFAFALSAHTPRFEGAHVEWLPLPHQKRA